MTQFNGRIGSSSRAQSVSVETRICVRVPRKFSLHLGSKGFLLKLLCIIIENEVCVVQHLIFYRCRNVSRSLVFVEC